MNQIAGLPDSDGDNNPDDYDEYPHDAAKWDDYSSNSTNYNIMHEAYIEKYGQIDLDEFLDKMKVSKSNYSLGDTKSDAISGVALDATYALTEKVTLYSQYAQLIGEIDTAMATGSAYNNWLIDHPSEGKTLGWGIVPIGAKAKLGPINLLAEYRMGSRRFVLIIGIDPMI